MFEYRLTQIPVASKKAKGLKTIQDRYAHALTEALNIEAKSGWEFVGQESFSVDEKSGVMKKAKAAMLTYLVFRRAVASDAIPLDQKLEKLKHKRTQTMIQPATSVATIAAAAASRAIEESVSPVDEKTEIDQPQTFSEPFPEPMPAYVPEDTMPEPFEEEPEQDVSRALPFPGPKPEKTMDMDSDNDTAKASPNEPTKNYDHSSGSKGKSIDAPILGPALRD